MKDENSGRASEPAFVTVRDPVQARLLTDPAALRFFEPFLARSRSASQAAAEVGCKLDTMLYRVRTFTKAGLLEVARLEPRRGRPIKHYRSSADAYFIPFDLTPYADLEERIREQMKPHADLLARALARRLRRSGRQGQRLFRTAEGEVFRQSAGELGVATDLTDWDSLKAHVEARAASVAEDLTTNLLLSDDEARALLLELYRLWYRLRAQEPAPSRRPYLWRFVLIPLEPEGDAA